MDVVLARTGKRAFASLLLLLIATPAWAEADATSARHEETGEPQWIWAQSYPQGKSPTGACYFRKTFEVGSADRAVVQITCDDKFDLYVNGRHVGKGNNWKALQTFDIQKLLFPGKNVIAVKAENTTGGSAGLVARVTVRPKGSTELSYSTDNTWKVRTTEVPHWEKIAFNDSKWATAFSIGEFGLAAPWGEQVVSADGGQTKRFSVTRDFRVERVIHPRETGSVIAVTFNEWGEILASREKGPLLLVIDKNKDGLPETVTTYCDKVTSCQGILSLNGDVFVTAEGPEGSGLYKLTDADANGEAETATMLLPFDRSLGEHGAHAVTLGPDGLIYVMLGNHATIKKTFDANSPYQNPYEGDLLEPKYEDPNGHAAGIKAPGGAVIRTDSEGSFVELVAGGLRNAYDMAFNHEGELFTFDSDMEWDQGLPWYRPTRVLHVVPGAEFGSRSGWSVWPDYFVDSLPPTIETGRGSPTGVEVYDHNMFPPAYHNAVFACDWSQGRILAIKAKQAGGTYEAQSEVFLEGRPLNVTDLAIGPDGWLYFVTGGRGTEGGIYRVVWTGKAVIPPTNNPILQALRQPQLNSAWARQKLAAIQEKMGPAWGRQLLDGVEDAANRSEYRTRALDLMQLYGPLPDTQLLARLTQDKQPEVRAKAAFLLGINVDKAATPQLTKLLTDTDPAVRRLACEAIARGRYPVDPKHLLAVLADPHRHVAWAAQRALERSPVDAWQKTAIDARNSRVFIGSSVAMLTVGVDREVARKILDQVRERLKGYLSDDDFIAMLRVSQLALIKGKINGDEVPELRRALADEYPAAEPRMNRELLRLVCYLQEPSALDRMLSELRSDIPETEKLHIAFCARFLKEGWTTERKLVLLDFFERARSIEGGHSLTGYVENVSRDFFATFDAKERQVVLAEGVRWPSAALGVLATLEQIDEPMVKQLIALDTKLPEVDSPAARRLQTGVAAVLGNNKDAASMAYLRELFEKNPDRRAELAMALAQSPGGENWPLLIRSLPVVEDIAAQEVLMQLGGCAETTKAPEALRQVILCGLKLGKEGGQHATNLLTKWTGQQVAPADATPDVAIVAWQKWFTETYPDLPPAVLPVDPEGTKWTYQELIAYLNGDEGSHGQPGRGQEVFAKAQCVKCHRHGPVGETIGPDLSTVGQRFQKKEILESTLFPSHFVSDQYASKTIITADGRTYTGIVGAAGDDAIVVLQPNAEKVTIKKENIAEVATSKKSAMPDGLLNQLTLEEIADLFAYLTGGTQRR
jgi:putative heme-binding domain-containing protein